MRTPIKLHTVSHALTAGNRPAKAVA